MAVWSGACLRWSSSDHQPSIKDSDANRSLNRALKRSQVVTLSSTVFHQDKAIPLRTPATWPSPRKDYVEGEIEEELMSRIKVVDFMMKEMWTFEVGDLVLMKDHVPTGKLEARWIGTHDGGESEPHGYLSLVRALWWKIERSHKRGQPEAMGGAIWDDSRSAVGKRG
ncbi:unnamed protein product [Umbelopsis sp. WA50703]